MNDEEILSELCFEVLPFSEYQFKYFDVCLSHDRFNEVTSPKVLNLNMNENTCEYYEFDSLKHLFSGIHERDLQVSSLKFHSMPANLLNLQTEYYLSLNMLDIFLCI